MLFLSVLKLRISTKLILYSVGAYYGINLKTQTTLEKLLKALTKEYDVKIQQLR